MEHDGHPGSSPLARGLHGCQSVNVQPRGIIPARAGFTFTAIGVLLTAGDHPRSRGVYHAVDCCGAADGGSSPLARGLPRRRAPRPPVRRIIPARAGFTIDQPVERVTTGDHPRSRGVYPFAVFALVDGAGSSPLARGLLRVRGGRGVVTGIIPARAGFTVATTNMGW